MDIIQNSVLTIGRFSCTMKKKNLEENLSEKEDRKFSCYDAFRYSGDGDVYRVRKEKR